MLFSDRALSGRLERAEGPAGAQFAEARRRLFPDSGAEWMECAGAYAVFDGIDSLDLLCARRYRPVEISNVRYRPIEPPAGDDRGDIRVHVIGP
jgi:hypothetical protein